MATKTETKPVVNLAGPEWGACKGQPLVDIRLPLLDGDENNITPDQTFRYSFANVNGAGKEDFSFQRGRTAKIPRDHFLFIYNNDKKVL